ncbi:WAP four-disulfide core domain protein 13 [Canis lupus dingo]|nr:WAP four-disulfide core domain protein 13 [Canis lupus dingo]
MPVLCPPSFSRPLSCVWSNPAVLSQDLPTHPASSMKSALLLQLLLIHLTPQQVPGSPKQHFMKYILEPPPCRSDPGNCTQFCTMQEDCKNGLQCCSAFCGIVCSLNKNINYDRTSHKNIRKVMVQPNLTPKIIGKKEHQIKPKSSRRREIITTKAEINGIEIKKH